MRRGPGAGQECSIRLIAMRNRCSTFKPRVIFSPDPFTSLGTWKFWGKEEGMLGSWAPLNDLNFEWEQMRTFIPPDVFSEICGTTLARLLAKRGAI